VEHLELTLLSNWSATPNTSGGKRASFRYPLRHLPDRLAFIIRRAKRGKRHKTKHDPKKGTIFRRTRTKNKACPFPHPCVSSNFAELRTASCRSSTVAKKKKNVEVVTHAAALAVVSRMPRPRRRYFRGPCPIASFFFFSLFPDCSIIVPKKRKN